MQHLKASKNRNQSLETDIESASYIPKVLIVEDDTDYAVQLMAVLREHRSSIPSHFEVDIATSPLVALQHAERDDIDIYILDLRLKDDEDDDVNTGKTLLVEILQKTNAGLIVHSSIPADVESVNLLSLGADDYIWKGERDYRKDLTRGQSIRAKVVALWRRVQQIRPLSSKRLVHNERAFYIGKWHFVIGNRELKSRDEEKVRITPTEHAFLRHLCTVENHEIDRQTFNVEILGRSENDKNKRMDNFVYRLRTKLGPTVQIVSARDGSYRLTNIKETNKLGM